MPDPRPVMFVGSVPLKPADAVFERIGSAIGTSLGRFPMATKRAGRKRSFRRSGRVRL